MLQKWKLNNEREMQLACYHVIESYVATLLGDQHDENMDALFSFWLGLTLSTRKTTSMQFLVQGSLADDTIKWLQRCLGSASLAETTRTFSEAHEHTPKRDPCIKTKCKLRVNS